MDTHNIGDVILNAMELKNLTQKEVASALHITYKSFNNYVTNARLPDIYTLLRIFDYLDINIYEAFHLQQAESKDFLITDKEASILKIFRSLDAENQRRLLDLIQFYNRDLKY